MSGLLGEDIVIRKAGADSPDDRLLRGEIGRRYQVVSRLFIDLIGIESPPVGHQLLGAERGDLLYLCKKRIRILK